MSDMRIVFASSLFSPFQIELLRELLKINGTTAHLLFSLASRQARGSHWQNYDWRDVAEHVHICENPANENERIAWIRGSVRRLEPGLLISQAFMRGVYHGVAPFLRHKTFPVGFWLEGVNPGYNFAYRRAGDLALWWRLRRADFVLAIGDRAERLFRRFCRNVKLIPYAQDLSPCFSIKRQRDDERPLHFLFSGQLVERHNIPLMLEATLKNLREKGDALRLVLAAHGPEQKTIDRFVARHPEMARVIVYDREYERWSDRLRPFAYSDVLLYPSSHSGWGLVVPEAMASGMPVISTTYVEAARYFVRHEVNGFLVKPNVEAVAACMARCIEQRQRVAELGARARQDAAAGDVRAVARQMVAAIEQMLGGTSRLARVPDRR
jgi:glycosyltransferase involved in cell wall biosynthesis